MSTTQENKAMRDYLELCKDWVFDLYSNHGVRFNEIYRALVHYREPWVDPSKLRSAIKRWKDNNQPEAWPLQQPQSTPGFVIPPPPSLPQNPAPDLLPLLEVVVPLPNAGRLSLPTAPRLAHPGRERLHQTDLSSFMPTSTMGAGTSMSSFPQPKTYGPYYAPQQEHDQAQSSSSTTSGPQPTSQTTLTRPTTYSLCYTPQQQLDQMQSSSSGTSASQAPSQATLPVFHVNPSPPAETAGGESMADPDHKPEIEFVCANCGEVAVGDNCLYCELLGC